MGKDSIFKKYLEGYLSYPKGISIRGCKKDKKFNERLSKHTRRG
jgi:hypothetical protein